ncbi:hypothetical protein V8F20_007244, partial [Naviculisporaceae sp. PSN 640]
SFLVVDEFILLSLLVLLVAIFISSNLDSPPVLGPILRNPSNFRAGNVLSLQFHGPEPPFVHLYLFTGFDLPSQPHSLLKTQIQTASPFVFDRHRFPYPSAPPESSLLLDSGQTVV